MSDLISRVIKVRTDAGLNQSKFAEKLNLDRSTTTLKLLKAEYKLDDLDIQIIEKYMELSPIERQVFKDYIKKIKDTE